MARVLLFLLIIALAVYAAVDVTNSDSDDRRGLPAGLWLVLVVVLPIVGPLLWFMVSRSQRAARAGGPTSGGSTAGPSTSGPTRPRRGPVAPDDDPEFLWRLEQEQRRRKQQDGDGSPSGDQSPE